MIDTLKAFADWWDKPMFREGLDERQVAYAAYYFGRDIQGRIEAALAAKREAPAANAAVEYWRTRAITAETKVLEFSAQLEKLGAGRETQLRDALRKLAKESIALIAIAEAEIREGAGNTNFNVFKLRTEEAFALLEHREPKEPLMKEIDLMQTTDHVVWAKEFVKRFGGDEELMASWFASAMMAMHDKMHGPPNGDAMQFLRGRAADKPQPPAGEKP